MTGKPIPDIAKDEPGKKVVMLGNVAIARGILEAGVVMAAAYPGTPSSEIMPAVAACVPNHPEIKIEWSVNEKVAFEVAYAGSMANARSVAAMKHVGVNVAADAFFTAAYHGVRGGMVLISADDPSQFSSQNEQDNRYFGLHALVPVFEPSSPNEAKNMMKYAFKFSEDHNSIVLFRTTTRLNHGRGDVEFGPIEKVERDYMFDWDRNRWVCVPSNTRPQRTDLLKRMAKIEEIADDFPFNKLTIVDEPFNGKKIGVLSTGMAYSHMMDALNAHKIADKISILKLGLVNPLPKKLLLKLLTSVEELLIVEELEPIFEEQVKAFAYENNLSVKIHGKDILPQQGELKPETLLMELAKFAGIEYKLEEIPSSDLIAPPRLPQMCPACSHRNLYHVMQKVEKKLKKKFINNNDIGCYSLGVYKPLEAADTALCMGGSIGMANGFAKLIPQDEKIVVTALLGDSTFFHSGIPPLINAVYNQNDVLIFISDNRYTSMTGGQVNPVTGELITGEMGTAIDLVGLVKGCGVKEENIFTHEAYDIPGMEEKLEKAVLLKGVRVFIASHMCSLKEIRVFRKNGTILPKFEVNPEICIGCQICIRKFGCPAINFDFEKRKAHIDQDQCRGCSSCVDVCPQGAFHQI